jgi:uncharacterized membrane protein
MNLLYVPVGIELALLGWAVLVPAAALALYALRRGFLAESSQQHLWLAGIVCLAALWTLQVRTGDDLRFGMLGVALYALIFGPVRAIVGVLAALALHAAFNDGAWINLGLNGALLGVAPAVLASALQRQLERRLPRNVFVFIIGNGMFVTLAVTALTSTVLLLVSLAAGAPGAMLHFGQYLGVALMIAWGEAVASGMLFSALVIFVPRLVLTYSQDRYLPARGRG